MEEVANNTEIEASTAAADVAESPKPDPAPDNSVPDSEIEPPAPADETPAPADEAPAPNGAASPPKETPVSAPEESTVELNKEPEPAEPQAENDGAKSNGEVQDNADAAKSVSPPKKQEKIDDEVLPPEVDSVVVPLHWHAKPCVHVTSIGGFVTEQELLPIFNVHGKVSSIVFENERRDTAIIRYEAEPGEGDQLIGRVRESLHNTQLGDRTLLIEAFRSDSLLFIGNLTPDIDDTMLRNMFEPHGSIERAFVLHNAAGRSKGYGFVEYSLKSQAMAAKVAMGNINMDGRVLRVEWSDCKRIADMFSTVLFVDRIPKEHPNSQVEGSLRSLFGRYGKVRDCHLAIGINNLYRGFGFIDFYHSKCADIAHESLDGHELEGQSIRVSFANPSKSAQSYKLRFGSQGSSVGHGGRGGFHGMMLNSSMRGHMPMPLLGHRFMGPGRSGMLGMGIGMQFGRGPHVGQALIDQGLVGSGSGMLGAGAAGMMGRAPVLNSVPPRRGMAVGGTLAPLPRFPGQGPVPINPATIAQVATAQAKAREEEAKARAEEYNQQQPQQTTDNLFKQSDPQYGYQQPYQQQPQQQSTPQPQYQHAGPQTQQPYAQYYAQPAQSYVQSQQQHQPQQGQYSQSSYYQQQPAQPEQAMPTQPYAYAQQYGQQYAHPGQQQYNQTYNPPAVQNSVQPYQQSAQTQVQTQYAQPTYTDHYVQQQQTQERQPQTNPVVPATNAASILPSQSQDGTQQQAYTSYYNQQAQQNVPQVATVSAQTSTAVGTSQQSLEAQWAAYYASQAAYQQQANYAQQQQPSVAASATYHEQPTATPDVGQKRTADQMEAGSQNQQMAYNYPQQTASYPQQTAAGAGTYPQQQPMAATAYQQHPSAVPGYQIQTNALPYQQQPSATAYQKPSSAAVSSGYDKHVPVADGYQQQQPAGMTAAFQPTGQGQHSAPMYDYSKRPRF